MPNTVNIKDAGGATVTVDTQGTAITGQTLESGGYGPMGWLSSLRNALTTNFTSLLGRLPNSLISGRLDVNIGASSVTQAISAASLPLPSGAATDATLTGGSQKAILRGAAKGSTAAADATMDAVDANTNALPVTLARPLDSNNDEVRAVACKTSDLLKGSLTSDLTTTTSTPLIASQGAGVRIYVDDVMVTNGHATVTTRVDILDGATIIWTGFAGPAGGGYSHAFKAPLQGTAATALNVQCTPAATVRASVSAHRGP